MDLIKTDFPIETNNFFNNHRQLFDGLIDPSADVEKMDRGRWFVVFGLRSAACGLLTANRGIHILHHIHTSIRHVVHMQEFAKDISSSPESDSSWRVGELASSR